MTISGTVGNGCTQGQEDQPDLTIIANGELDIDGATFDIAGDFELKNDPTLDDSAFPVAAGAPLNYYASRAAGQQPLIGIRNTIFRANPAKRPDGPDAQNGGDGKDGKTWRLRARGSLIFGGGVQVIGQNGGDGGDGDHQSTTNANSTGGNGGNGGLIRVQATGDLVFGGGGNRVKGGDAGHGGNSSSTGLENPAPAKAASASSRGGNGGRPGLVDIRALQSIQVNAGALTVEVGSAGNGGNSESFGGEGVDADQRAGPAQAGGDATSRAGDGGDVPDKMFRAGGNVIGANEVDVIGGDAGDAGEVLVVAGDGGDGDETDPDGAVGGNGMGTAGSGGDAEATDIAGSLIGIGGDASIMEFFFSGNGGDGWRDCIAPNFKEGGDGGNAGDHTAERKNGGTGRVNGAATDVTVTGPVGVGGDGMDGEPPGVKGGQGNDFVGFPRMEPGNNFPAGKDGVACKSGVYVVGIGVVSDPDGHEPFLGGGGLTNVHFIDLQIDPVNNQILMTAPFPFTDISGDWDPVTGQFTAVGIENYGSGAYPNITFTFTGVLTCNNVLSGEIVLSGFPPKPPNTAGRDARYGLSGGRMTTPSPPAAVGAMEAGTGGCLQ